MVIEVHLNIGDTDGKKYVTKRLIKVDDRIQNYWLFLIKMNYILYD